MEIIVFEKESFQKLIDELTIKIIQNVERHYQSNEWIGEEEAKRLLGIKGSGKTSLQRMRDNLQIEFSKYGNIIRYSRSSIMHFIEQHRRSLDRL